MVSCTITITGTGDWFWWLAHAGVGVAGVIRRAIFIALAFGVAVPGLGSILLHAKSIGSANRVVSAALRQAVGGGVSRVGFICAAILPTVALGAGCAFGRSGGITLSSARIANIVGGTLIIGGTFAHTNICASLANG